MTTGRPVPLSNSIDTKYTTGILYNVCNDIESSLKGYSSIKKY